MNPESRRNRLLLLIRRFWLNITFIFALILIIGIHFVSYWQINKFQASNRLLVNSYQVLNASNHILLNLLGAESIVRGFLITGNRAAYVDLNDKLRELEEFQKQTKVLTIDNIQQQRKIALLGPLIQERIKTLQQAMQFKENKKSALSRSEIIHAGDLLSLKIGGMVKSIKDSELILLKNRTKAVWELNSIIFIMALSNFINVLLLIFIVLLLNRQLSKSMFLEKKASLSLYELKYHDEEISLINEMSSVLQSSSYIEEIFEWIKKYCIQLLPHTAGILYITNTSKNFLEVKSQWNHEEIIDEFFLPEHCWGLRQGKIYKFFDREKSIPCKHLGKKKKIQPYFCMPLLAHNDVIGLLYIEFSHLSAMPKNEILPVLNNYESIIHNIADHISMAISNITLRDILKDRSLRDPLTNLYNRAYLSESLNRDIQLAQRQNILLSVVMVDIDHFKDTNDAFGHEAGDFVLKEFAKVVTHHIRQSDIACRYGGEEFFLLFFNISLEETYDIVDKMRKVISEMKLNFGAQSIGPITASMGIAMYPEHANTAEELIDAADRALYQSKKDGRNKVTIFHV